MLEGAEKVVWERLLPPAERIVPVHPNHTFGDCGYTQGSFSELPEQLQLKVVCDLIRQGIDINYFPTPEDEGRFSGDCFTAAKAYVGYATKLELTGEFRLASVRRRPFDFAGRKTTRHIIVLRRDPETDLWQTIDPAPMAGYAFGTVGAFGRFDGVRLTGLGEEPLFYEDISLLNSDDLAVIAAVNLARNRYYVQRDFTSSHGHSLLEEVEQLWRGREHLDSWMSELYFILAMAHLHEGDALEFARNIRTTAQLDPLKPKILEAGAILPSDVVRLVKDTNNAFQEVAQVNGREWLGRAQRLFATDEPSNYPEAIMLLQWAFWELHRAGLTAKQVPVIELAGGPTPLFSLNPRGMSGLTTVWIKPSAYFMGIQTDAKECMSALGAVVWEQEVNLSSVNEYGYRPILAAHPHGKRNAREHFGPALICLVASNPRALCQQKGEFRETFRGNDGESVMWFDGESIRWDSTTMNHIHCADSRAESVVSLLLTNPEFALVTRWSYPHPCL